MSNNCQKRRWLLVFANRLPMKISRWKQLQLGQETFSSVLFGRPFCWHFPSSDILSIFWHFVQSSPINSIMGIETLDRSGVCKIKPCTIWGPTARIGHDLSNQTCSAKACRMGMEQLVLTPNHQSAAILLRPRLQRSNTAWPSNTGIQGVGMDAGVVKDTATFPQLYARYATAFRRQMFVQYRAWTKLFCCFTYILEAVGFKQFL